MALFIKKDPTRSSGINWPSVKKIFVKKDPNRSALINWPQVLAAYVKVSATQWKKFFGAVYTISKPVAISYSLNANSLWNLTGTNYDWTPNTANPPSPYALTYDWKWNNGISTTNLVSATQIPNGTSTGTDYSDAAVNPVPLTKFSANATNTYFFTVTAPDGSFSQTSFAVQGPTNISVSINSIQPDSAGLVWNISTGAGSYKVEYKLTSSSTWISAGTTLSTSMTINSLTGIYTGTAYDFRVTPYTGLTGDGYPGNPATTTTNGLYYVNFYPNGGTVNGSTSNYTVFQASPGAAITVSIPTRTGYLFQGWYDQQTGGNQIIGSAQTSYTPSANTAAWARWQATFYVYYNLNGGSGGSGPGVTTNTTMGPYDSGVSVSIQYPTTAPSKNGALFVGWSTDPNASTSTYNWGGTTGSGSPSTFTITASTTFYAVYAPPNISSLTLYDASNVPGVTFVGNSGTNIGLIQWTNASDAISGAGFGVSVNGTGNQNVTYSTPNLDTSYSFVVLSPGGTEYASVSNTVPGKVKWSWNQTNAASYSITFAVAGAGTGTITGNNSNAYVESQAVTTGGRTITFQSISLYSLANQQGSSTTRTTGCTPSFLTVANNVVKTGTGAGNLVYTSPTPTPSFPYFPTPSFPYFPTPSFPYFPTPSFPYFVGCVHGDTLIRTLNGYVKARDVYVGQKLASYTFTELPRNRELYDVELWTSNTLSGDNLTDTAVESIKVREVAVTVTINGKDRRFSLEHMLLARRDDVYMFVQAGVLREGDYLVYDTNDNMNEILITDIEYINEVTDVYDFSVTPNDLFIAGDIIAHNKKGLFQGPTKRDR